MQPMKDDGRLARGRRLFEYHCYEGEDSADAELWHHTHQSIEVLARTQHGHHDGPTPTMYRIRFADGYECEVWDDELVLSPGQFELDDYGEPTIGAK